MSRKPFKKKIEKDIQVSKEVTFTDAIEKKNK